MVEELCYVRGFRRNPDITESERGNVRITGFQRIAIDYPATRTAGNYLDQRSRPRRPESGMDSGGVLRKIVEAKSRVEQVKQK